MSTWSDIAALLADIGCPVYSGYAPTGATLPYVVQRPLIVDPNELAITGDALAWDWQTALYTAGESVEASFNLALVVMGALQGKLVQGCAVSTSMGYSGAQVEGHYNSQVTVQLNQGGI